MKVIFTCGGTGGHINPAIAVANLLKERRPETEILFVGAEDGMENKLVPRAGYPLETLRISNFQRRLSPSGIWHNAVTAVHIAGSLRKAGQIIDRFQPDVIVGTGGYASFPALKMGARKRIPTAVHESNAVPGLATRLVADDVSCIMISFAESRSRYHRPERVVVTGTPVRSEFIYTTRAATRAALGLDDRPLVASYWGSLGAREMNKIIARFMVLESRDDAFHHIHATGSFGWRWMPDYVRQQGVELEKHPNIQMVEYIHNMPTVMAAADLVICRAGASTISEIEAAATPCIMVPSPNVTDHHQEHNAELLAQRGSALVLPEAECSGERLYETVTSLLAQPERLEAMRRAQQASAVLDSAERICQQVLTLAGKRG